MRDVTVALLQAFDWVVLTYFLVLNLGYVALFAIASVQYASAFLGRSFAGHDDIFRSPLTPSVSIVVPAYNEESGIAAAVRNLLDLRYPDHEVIVVDDGSKDATFACLAEAFDLVAVERVVPQRLPTIGAVLSTHMPRSGEPLLVIRKENAGRRSEALNCGLNAATGTLVCLVDADSLLDETALLRVVKPFVDDPRRVVASGGVVRAGNGCRVEDGRIVDARMPKHWLERIQVIEYLRAFLLGRTGWSRVGGLLIISGAFGLFRRDLVMELGGLDIDCIGEDCELVARIHRHQRRLHRDYRVVFISEPVCWTEVPRRVRDLATQRQRWSRGLAEVLWKHRRMVGNPRYGLIGLLALPYFLIFELLGCLIELLGVIAVSAGFVFGAVNTPFAIAFAGIAIALGVALSLFAVAVEEFSFHRYPRWSDLAYAAAAAVVENIGYRQLHAWWRCRGLWSALRGTKGAWGTIERGGLERVPAP